MTTGWRLAVTWTARVLLVAVLGFVAFAIAVLVVIPKATHGVALTVLTGSMTPGIPVGSVVVDRPVDPATLHVGDVATYQKEPGKAEYITHRIVAIDGSTTPAMFTFKGDANRGADAMPVPATAIRGKVWFHVPYLGALRDTLHTKGGVAGVVVVVLAGYALVQASAAARERRRPEASGACGPDSEPPATDVPAEGDGRVMVLATLPVATETAQLDPGVTARLLGGILLDQQPTAFTVLVAEPAARAARTVQILGTFRPIALEVTVPDRDPAPAPGGGARHPHAVSGELVAGDV